MCTRLASKFAVSHRVAVRSREVTLLHTDTLQLRVQVSTLQQKTMRCVLIVSGSSESVETKEALQFDGLRMDSLQE
eukprot:s1897_g14.t1